MKIEQVPLDKIIVSGRTREDFGEVGELAQSISEHGLLQPLIIEDNYHLRAGERRLRALRLLKKETAPCIFLSSLSELQRLEIELEENLKRKDFSWQEEVTLKEKIYQLKKKEDPSWTIEKSAGLTGKSVQSYKQDLFLAKSLKDNPEVAQTKEKSDAYRKSQRIREREIRRLVVEATKGEESASGAEPTASNVYSIGGVTLTNEDCLKGIKALPDNSIDLLVTDFPFGVDLDKNFDFNKSWDQVYEDKPIDLLEGLLPGLASEFARVLKPGAHFYIFYPSIHHQAFLTELSKHLKVYQIPLIWNKRTGGTTFTPYSRYAPNYEPIFYGWKGDSPRKLASCGYCVLNFDNLIKKVHPAEKPIDLLSYLITQSSIEGETVLETFSGSGVTMEACLRLGRKGIAFELSKRWWDVGVERLKGVYDSLKEPK